MKNVESIQSNVEITEVEELPKIVEGYAVLKTSQTKCVPCIFVSLYVELHATF